MSSAVERAQKYAATVSSTPRLDNALTMAMDYVQDDLQLVNAVIMEEMHSSVALIPRLAGHLITAGGKRIRPLITLLAARLFDPVRDPARVCQLAACVEFIHAATLLHDDVVDDSHLRRGQATANTIWGNKSSVLVGDFLFSRAFQLMVRDGSLAVLELLSRTAARISEGEVLQQMTIGNPALSREEYFEIATAKTAPLFEAAAHVAGIVAERSETELQALAVFGRNLGITFQLIDDVLDYTVDDQNMGKNLGDDFREGKITLPVIVAYQAGSEIEQAFWRRTLGDHQQREHDLHQALIYLNKHQAFEQTRLQAQQKARDAQQSLQIFSDSAARDHLLQMTNFALNRLY